MPQFKPITLTLFLLLLSHTSYPASAQYPGAKPPPDDLKAGFDAVGIDDAKRILTFLATRCEGRGTGQRGFEKAARFVANEFGHIGLKPLGDNGTYFQRARVATGRGVRIVFRGSGGTAEFGGMDYTYTQSSNFKFDGPIKLSGLPLFIEYGGKPANLPKAADLKGRIVFFHFPANNIDEPGEQAALDEFFDSLSKAGPLAFFGVLDKLDETKKGVDSGLFHGPRWGLADEAKQENQPGVRFYGNVSARAMSSIMDAAKAGKADVDRPGSVAVTLGKEPLSLEIKVSVDRVWAENVAGLLEGSDATMKAEYVVVGGHLDHFGIQHGTVYPGADDDGSGATDIIEIARMMAANPKKPRRSIVFVTFFGEEQGLLGSRFFTQHAPVSTDKIVAELQMDMVGRDSDGPQQDGPYDSPNPKHVDKAADNIDTIRVVGSKKVSTDMDRVILEMNEFVNFRLKDDSEYVYGRSDDANFVRKGIPTAWLFSAFHPDYHQPTDTVDKIDWVKLTNAARLFYLAAHAIADADAPPKRDVSSH